MFFSKLNTSTQTIDASIWGFMDKPAGFFFLFWSKDVTKCNKVNVQSHEIFPSRSTISLPS
jgi:hypothetical protein